MYLYADNEVTSVTVFKTSMAITLKVKGQRNITPTFKRFLHSLWDILLPSDIILVVLDRVRHFRPIPIHRFFAVNRYRYASRAAVAQRD